MNEPTGSRRDAASTLFNLPDYRVIDAVDQPDGTRRVLVESLAPPGCPACGVISERVQLNQCLANVGISWPVLAVFSVACAAACAAVVACGLGISAMAG